MRIFLTGATGFLGSHLAQYLSEQGHKLLCLKRSTSVYDKSLNVLWVNNNKENWENEVVRFKPEVTIHTAWIGVSAKDRIDENKQKNNVDFTNSILNVSASCNKFIAIGSQDEYGYTETVIDETHTLNPISPYGKNKVECLKKVERFCSEKNICWYWLRVFSIYGERQGDNWLIPSIILQILDNKKSMDTTEGKQAYAYLYVLDFCDAISLMLNHNGDSGIYNLSSEKSITLKNLFLLIREKTNPLFQFNFGVMPYREHQSMLIQGDSSKFIKTFGAFEKTSLEDGLHRVIDAIKKRINENI